MGAHTGAATIDPPSRDMSIAVSVDPLLLGAPFRSPPGVVNMLGPVHMGSAEAFEQQVEAAVDSGAPVVMVEIDSNGGDVQALMKMINVINACKVPVATILKGGRAMSAGAILFAYGTKGFRFIAPDSSVMVHDVSSGMQGKLGELEASVEHAKMLNERIFSGIDERAGKPKGYFIGEVMRRGRADWFLDAEEAVREGLADHVGIPVLQVDVRVEMALRASGAAGAAVLARRSPPKLMDPISLSVMSYTSGTEKLAAAGARSTGANFAPAGAAATADASAEWLLSALEIRTRARNDGLRKALNLTEDEARDCGPGHKPEKEEEESSGDDEDE